DPSPRVGNDAETTERVLSISTRTVIRHESGQSRRAWIVMMSRDEDKGFGQSGFAVFARNCPSVKTPTLIVRSVAIPIRFREGGRATGEMIKVSESSKLMKPCQRVPGRVVCFSDAGKSANGRHFTRRLKKGYEVCVCRNRLHMRRRCEGLMNSALVFLVVPRATPGMRIFG